MGIHVRRKQLVPSRGNRRHLCGVWKLPDGKLASRG